MANGCTTYWLNLAIGNLMHAPFEAEIPDTYYLGVSSTDPSGIGATEPSGDDYSRVALSGLSEPVGGVVTNSSSLALPKSESYWGTVKYWVVFDKQVGGNLLFYGDLTREITIGADSVLTFLPGEMKLTLRYAN